MAFFSWSKTAGNNANADLSINWAEGMAPSAVNDSARAQMARTAEWRDDISGTITTAGTSTAYAVSTSQGFDTLVHMNGAMIAFVPHITNGATVTLTVDGGATKPLRFGPGLELQSGVLIQGTPYVATYNNADGAFYLQGGFANPYGIPLGGLLPYTGSTAPNSAFVLPFGQAISRTTYATYFSLVGTTFGVGDGSTTFNVPDLRGRAVAGLDNMGGSAASRITVAGGNFDGTALGGAGGGENQTLTQAQLPAFKPAITITDTHSHTFGAASSNGTFLVPIGGAQPVPFSPFGSSGTFQGSTSGTSGGSISAAFTSNLGSGNSHTVLQPTMVLPYILRII